MAGDDDVAEALAGERAGDGPLHHHIAAILGIAVTADEAEPTPETADTQETSERVPVVGTVTDDKVVIVTPDGMGVAPASPSEGAKG